MPAADGQTYRRGIGGMTCRRATEVDWDALTAAAVEAMGHAYAPYSDFPVGAAAWSTTAGW